MAIFLVGHASKNLWLHFCDFLGKSMDAVRRRTFDPSIDVRTVHTSAAAEKPIVNGIENVKLCLELHGMPAAHLEAVARYVADNKIVLGIRASTRGSDKLKLAGHQTKNLSIKAKTCPFGIARARICVDQTQSKHYGNPAIRQTSSCKSF